MKAKLYSEPARVRSRSLDAFTWQVLTYVKSEGSIFLGETMIRSHCVFKGYEGLYALYGKHFTLGLVVQS